MTKNKETTLENHHNNQKGFLVVVANMLSVKGLTMLLNDFMQKGLSHTGRCACVGSRNGSL